jgi:hypothetical protein
LEKLTPEVVWVDPVVLELLPDLHPGNTANASIVNTVARVTKNNPIVFFI